MARIVINQERCKGCLLCISFCPKGLIKKSAKLSQRGLNFVEFKACAAPGLIGGAGTRSCAAPGLTGAAGTRFCAAPGLTGAAGTRFCAECVGCMRCAVICPDCCIEVYK